MDSILINRLSKSLTLTGQLAEVLNEAQLACRLGNLKSNCIGSQFWCIVGARESYRKAFEFSGWQGFSCSLTNGETRDLIAIHSALERSRTGLMDSLSRHEMNDQRVSILIDLLEHEAQHHGQLIRYFYANQIHFPKDFARCYALSQPTGSTDNPAHSH